MDDIRVSKRLSLVLRHQPGSVGVELDHEGWVNVTVLLDALAPHGITLSRADLARVVEESDKQRLEWNVEADRTCARQGHSVDVDLELEPAVPPAVLFHGTPVRNVDSILHDELERLRRHHSHLSADEETANRVGSRRGEHVVLRGRRNGDVRGGARVLAERQRRLAHQRGSVGSSHWAGQERH